MLELIKNNNMKNVEKIIARYIAGESAPRIAKDAGIGRTAIYKLLSKNNIKIRMGKDYRPKSNGKEKEIIKMYRSGISAAGTGKVFDVCESTVFFVLREYKIPVRCIGIHDVTKSVLWKGGVSKDKEYQKKRKNSYRNKRKKDDPLYKMIHTLRARIACFFKRGKLGKTGKIRKNKKTIEMLGANFDIVFKHIESQFQEGMTWENYGQKGWHVDHKIPLCSAKNESDLVTLMHWSNLQPLWAYDNHKKGGKICH